MSSKFCVECGVWYNPSIPSDWATAHVCMSDRFNIVRKQIIKDVEELIKQNNKEILKVLKCRN